MASMRHTEDRLRRIAPAQLGLAVVEVVIAYEWLLSGLSKCFSGGYLSGLPDSLSGMAKDNPNTWYVWFMQHMAMPHCTFFGCLVAIGELLTALALLGGAALWLTGPERWSGRWGRLLQGGVIAGLFGAALMTINYYLMAGKTVPWVNTNAPFDEGLSIDGLLTLITLGLLAVHALALRRSTLPAISDADQSPFAAPVTRLSHHEAARRAV